MITTIKQITEQAGTKSPKVLAVAAAHDEDVLCAVVSACQTGFISPILIGNSNEIGRILSTLQQDASTYKILQADSAEDCAKVAVSLITQGSADFLMKGFLATSDLMRAVVNRDSGLRTGQLISHVSLYETTAYPKLLAVTDGGMNPAPDLDKKASILENAADMLCTLGYNTITAACICGSETIDRKIQATIDAHALSEMHERWNKYNMNVLGPVGLDLAISKTSCKHKGFHQTGGGDADILLVPTYEVGNAIGKTLSYFSDAKSAGIILGAKVPIVLVSRADNSSTKLASIALGSLLCPT